MSSPNRQLHDTEVFSFFKWTLSSSSESFFMKLTVCVFRLFTVVEYDLTVTDSLELRRRVKGERLTLQNVGESICGTHTVYVKVSLRWLQYHKGNLPLAWRILTASSSYWNRRDSFNLDRKKVPIPTLILKEIAFAYSVMEQFYRKMS